MTRVAREAAAGSCVTMITVRPSRRSSSRNASTCSRVSGIEVPRRLVGQNHGRIVRQRPRQRDPLLLADAQLARLVVHARFQADLRPAALRFAVRPRPTERRRSISGICTFSSADRYGIKLNV